MELGALTEHAGIVGGIAVALGVTLRFGPDAVLRLIAGLTHMFSSNEERAKRALNVLTALRPGQQLPAPNETPQHAKAADAEQT